MKNDFDVIVIGAGNAGLAACHIAKNKGLSVAIIEEDKVGGTCPLRGCVPKKVLVAAMEALDKINNASFYNINVKAPVLDWKNLIKRKQQIISPLSSSAKKNLEQSGIKLINGEAHFTNRRSLEVNNTLFKANKIVIATGSIPRPLSFSGEQYLITSDDLLNMEELPNSLAFIGAGVIGFEFAHILARAGVQITLLEVDSHILSQKDPDTVDLLVSESEKLGIKIFTGIKVTSIITENSKFLISFLHEEKNKNLQVDLVANGAGRIPNINKLNLEAAGIKYEGNYIILDKYLRSLSNQDIFVAGDPVKSPQLSPVATYEGKIVGHNLLNEKQMISADYSCIPSCIFTLPALSSVGLTEVEAKEKGLQFISKENDLTKWISGKIYAETPAFSKILIEEDTNKILGAHIIGHESQEIINIIALAMKYNITKKQLKEMVFTYPTFSSDIPSML